MTREEVLRYDVWTDIYDDTRAEESPDGEWVRYKDHAKALDDTKMEIDRLQGAVDATLDHLSFLEDENAKIKAILAALREPSREMRDAVRNALNNRSVTDPIIGEDIDEIIEAAVAAAEREVTNDEG